jgi:glycosyltransferase involved in cell wall biosynthesis
MEQTLGHVTHDKNLRHWVSGDGQVVPKWLPVPFDAADRFQTLPGFRSNWTLRGSARAAKAIREAEKEQRFDALFLHTQVIAQFARQFTSRIPSIVSLDATPVIVDSMGDVYQHKTGGNRLLQAYKHFATRRTFRSGRMLVSWSHAAKKSLIEQYGIAEERIHVIPPGIDLSRWQFERFPMAKDGKVRLLFVGADFDRKGGRLLLEAMRAELHRNCELDIVTRNPVEDASVEGVRVHNGLTANSPQLMSLYEKADIFVFPTLGDCLPLAVMEAMAAELPVVATCVGSLDEEVEDGRTGYLVPPGNVEALIDRIQKLVRSADLRRTMGWAGRRRAEQLFNGRTNYGAVIDLLKRCADGRP